MCVNTVYSPNNYFMCIFFQNNKNKNYNYSYRRLFILLYFSFVIGSEHFHFRILSRKWLVGIGNVLASLSAFAGSE